MIRASERDFVGGESVRISLTVDPLVVVPDDTSDIGVQINLLQDGLANRRMLLHLPSLLERQAGHP